MADYLTSLNKLYSAWLSPNMLERPHLEGKLKKSMNQMVKMRALFAPASKESHIPREVFDAIQTLSRNLLCTLELLADAYWSSRESHYLMLNARSLRSAQLLMLDSLEKLSDMLLNGTKGDEGALNHQLNESVEELKQLMQEMNASQHLEAPIYGYVWLSMQVAEQLQALGDLITMTMRKEEVQIPANPLEKA